MGAVKKLSGLLGLLTIPFLDVYRGHWTEMGEQALYGVSVVFLIGTVLALRKRLCGRNIHVLSSQHPVSVVLLIINNTQFPLILLTSSRWPTFGTSHPHAPAVTAGGLLSQCLRLRLGNEP